MLVKTLALAAAAAVGVVAAPSGSDSKPNIILILTDDQDTGTISRSNKYLPRIHKYLVDEGVYYENFFAPVSVCCPSRVSLLRTQLAHNHNITFVSKPWGGWDVFNKYGYVNNTLPDFLQAVGYDTYYTGKLMNDHTDKNCESLPVSGWTSSDILVDPYTYDYWNPGFSRDNGPAIVHKGEYSTDLVNTKALDYLSTALESDTPFFLGIAPVASHSWISYDRLDLHDTTKLVMNIPAAHPRHAAMFPTEELPRTPSFNPNEPQGVSWVKHLPKLNSTQEAYLDDFYRGRLRSLQPVDELVEKLVLQLEKEGKLDNTYIFYTSDNGYALGTHRRQPGKTLGFEEDIHVPLIARGPGIKKGLIDGTSSYSMVDLSRTILDLAGAKTNYENDGQPSTSTKYWVLGAVEGVYSPPGALLVNNTYRTLRVHDETPAGPATWSYSVWCTGERELYDLQADPYQVNNLLKPLNALGRFAPFNASATAFPDGLFTEPALSPKLQLLLNRLDGLLLVLKTCKDVTCRKPYDTLFPSLVGKNVDGLGTFEHALRSEFDQYFENLPKVRFDHCALGFQSRLEKPEWEDELAFNGAVGSGIKDVIESAVEVALGI